MIFATNTTNTMTYTWTAATGIGTTAINFSRPRIKRDITKFGNDKMTHPRRLGDTSEAFRLIIKQAGKYASGEPFEFVRYQGPYSTQAVAKGQRTLVMASMYTHRVFDKTLSKVGWNYPLVPDVEVTITIERSDLEWKAVQ